MIDITNAPVDVREPAVNLKIQYENGVINEQK